MATQVAFSELDSWLQAQSDNTVSTPYELEITGLTVSDIGSSLETGTLGYILKQNGAKYVDLSNTELPDGVIDMTNCFHHCISIVGAPVIPDSVTNMSNCFDRCTSFNQPITIPNSVTNMGGCFSRCTLFNQPITIPDNVTDMSFCFSRCPLFNKPVTIPDSVTDMTSCFQNCTSLNSPITFPQESNVLLWGCFEGCTSFNQPVTIPNGVTNMYGCFKNCSSFNRFIVIPDSVIRMFECFSGCTSFNQQVSIPDSVLDMSGTFQNCSSLVSVLNVPSNVTNIANCFNGCSLLEEIVLFEADLKTLVANDYAKNSFNGCTSLTKIGVYTQPIAETDDWHAFRLKFGADTIEGKVYDKDGNGTAITQTQITKDTLQLPIKTDEVWFPDPNEYSDSDIDDIIEAVILNKYSYFKNKVIPPDRKSFVMYAHDPADFITNINFGGAKELVTSTKTLDITGDLKIFISGTGITVTLSYNSEPRSVVEVFAFNDCTLTYYTDANTTASLSMLAGTSAQLVFFNGWKFAGVYGAVWN